MKNNNLMITGVASLVALVAVAGVAMSTFASESETNDNNYGFRANKPMHRYMSDEDKAEREAKIEERKAEMEAKHEAVVAALEAGDYNAWVEAVGEDSPILEKITVDNFSRFVEVHNLRAEAKTIMEELGIEKEGFRHKMKGGRFGRMNK